MRLDWDCIRDILLCVEENTGLRKSCRFVDTSDDARKACEATGTKMSEPAEYQIPLDEQYGNETLMYHIHYCCRDDSDLLDYYSDSTEMLVHIKDLSVAGHKTLSVIRQPAAWRKFKQIAAKVGISSLPTFINAVLKFGIDSYTASISAQ